MNLDDAQKQTVSKWISEGLKLSDIQKRLGTELGLHLTYMEVRFLVDDLKLTPKDIDPPKSPLLTPGGSSPSSQGAGNPQPPPQGSIDDELPSEEAPKGVTVSVAEVSRPGAMVSGRVTFSDGQSAEWYLDQMGRLGLAPQQPGYRPAQEDIRAFQAQLQNELARMGF